MNVFRTCKRALGNKVVAVVGVAALAFGGGAVVGAPVGAQSSGPAGHVDTVTVSANQVRVIGWAADTSAPDQEVKVDLYVDGEYAASGTTDMARPDVAAAFPAYGATTGFDLRASLPKGEHEVCAWAISNAQRNQRLGCQRVTAGDQPAQQPVGFLDAVTVDDQQVTVSGWAALPGSPNTAATVDVYVDGDYATTARTDISRPDVVAAFANLGPNTGFRVATGVSDGDHSVCAFAVSESTLNTRLGCKSVTVSGTTGMRPVGYLDAVEETNGGVRLAGWAADPSSPSRDVAVDVYVDGDYRSTLTANQSRPDVAAVFAQYGATTGFSASVGLSGGAHRVCAFAIDEDALNTRLGCKTVDVEAKANVQPSGMVDAIIVGSGQVRVVGWAADSATPDRDVSVDVYVDGAYAATGTSDGTRPDVQAAYPSYGPTTGFDVTASVPSGEHRVCAYAVDTVALNTLLTCATVTVGT